MPGHDGAPFHDKSRIDLIDRRRACLTHDHAELVQDDVQNLVDALLSECAQTPDVRPTDADGVSLSLDRIHDLTRDQATVHFAGVRVPADAVCAAILDALDGEPLFCSSVPVSEDGDQLVCHGPLDVEGSWCSLVDFVVDAGPRPIEGSTIYDLAADDGPTLVRERLGPPIPELDLVVA